MYHVTIGQLGPDEYGPPPPPGPGIDWSKVGEDILSLGTKGIELWQKNELLKTQRELAKSAEERAAIDLQIAKTQQEIERIKAGRGSIPSWTWIAAAGVGAIVLVVVLTR